MSIASRSGPRPASCCKASVYEDETDRFDPALIRYKFPLVTGERWDQRLVDLDKPPAPYGGITRHVAVGGYEKIATPAGTFDAIGLRVIMQMDDETFWRLPDRMQLPRLVCARGRRLGPRGEEVAVARQGRAGRVGIPPGPERNRRAHVVHARTLARPRAAG